MQQKLVSLLWQTIPYLGVAETLYSSFSQKEQEEGVKKLSATITETLRTPVPLPKTRHYLISVMGGVLSDIKMTTSDERALEIFNEWTSDEYKDQDDPYQAFLDDGGNDGDNDLHWVERAVDDESEKIF